MEHEFTTQCRREEGRTLAHVFLASDLAIVRRVFRSDAPTEDEAVWVIGIGKVGGVGDDGVEAPSDALVLIGEGDCKGKR